jgi:alkylation response protein AidB-like acyl-CoA dehydrogenase
MDAATVRDRVSEIAAGFAHNRRERQFRRELDPKDFAALSDAGYLLTGVPVEMGGLWESPGKSARPICEILRALAHGDSSVALVSSMHAAVTAFWLSSPTAPTPFTDAWATQRRWVSERALDGAWWGTITSEPGSGGDVLKTRAAARISPHGPFYLLSGQKHFGSGSGITSYMITTALANGDTEPDWFFLDVRDAKWDGSTGMKLIAPWDGHGMTATQSHAFDFADFPATRLAWPGGLRPIMEATGGFINSCFTAVIVGIVDVAMAAARATLEPRRGGFRSFERVEWARVDVDAWLIRQAYEGMLRAMEERDTAAVDVLRAKTAVAELAESTLDRICRILGGSGYARSSPFGHWYEDVRALGFLRPPWALAFDRLYEDSWI